MILLVQRTAEVYVSGVHAAATVNEDKITLRKTPHTEALRRYERSQTQREPCDKCTSASLRLATATLRCAVLGCAPRELVEAPVDQRHAPDRARYAVAQSMIWQHDVSLCLCPCVV